VCTHGGYNAIQSFGIIIAHMIYERGGLTFFLLYDQGPFLHLGRGSDFKNELLDMFLEIGDIENAKRVLGVKDHGNMDEIKKGYRRMVKKFHPDISPLSEDYDKFIVIHDAYNTLLANIKGRGVGVFRETYPQKGDAGFRVMDFEEVSKRGEVELFRFH